MNGHDTRHILGRGNLDDPITIEDIREGLVTAPGDRVDLTKGGEETFDNVIGNLRGTVVQIEKATSGVSTHHTERDITEADSRRQHATTVKWRLEGDADSTITQELQSGDGVLAEGLQQFPQNSGRANRLVDSRWKKRHQTRATVKLGWHDEVKLGWARLNWTEATTPSPTTTSIKK